MKCSITIIFFTIIWSFSFGVTNSFSMDWVLYLEGTVDGKTFTNLSDNSIGDTYKIWITFNNINQDLSYPDVGKFTVKKVEIEIGAVSKVAVATQTNYGHILIHNNGTGIDSIQYTPSVSPPTEWSGTWGGSFDAYLKDYGFALHDEDGTAFQAPIQIFPTSLPHISNFESANVSFVFGPPNYSGDGGFGKIINWSLSPAFEPPDSEFPWILFIPIINSIGKSQP